MPLHISLGECIMIILLLIIRFNLMISVNDTQAIQRSVRVLFMQL